MLIRSLRQAIIVKDQKILQFMETKFDTKYKLPVSISEWRVYDLRDCFILEDTSYNKERL